MNFPICKGAKSTSRFRFGTNNGNVECAVPRTYELTSTYGTYLAHATGLARAYPAAADDAGGEVGVANSGSDGSVVSLSERLEGQLPLRYILVLGVPQLCTRKTKHDKVNVSIPDPRDAKRFAREPLAGVPKEHNAQRRIRKTCVQCVETSATYHTTHHNLA